MYLCGKGEKSSRTSVIMENVTTGTIKLVNSLTQKKYRTESGLFVAEGNKCVRDTWGHFRCRMLIATNRWYEQHATAEMFNIIRIADMRQMSRMSQFSTPSEVMALYELPQYELTPEDIKGRLTIALDTIQDPGNLGTIIRVADWYGIRDIVCSKETVDAFGHKVIQATMGAISRVRVHYTDLPQWFESVAEVPVIGTYLDGDNLYSAELPAEAIVLFGNEGRGISPKLAKYVTRRVLIPSYPADVATSESLNVSVAVAITVSELRRRIII